MGSDEQSWPMSTLASRVAVITGAASGIGFGMAEAFLSEGARVVLADLDADGLLEAAGRLSGSANQVLAVVTDVTDLESVRHLARATMDRFGAVDVVCNNAGVWTLGYQWEIAEEDWRWVIDVNLWGVIHGIQVFVPMLIANSAGGQVVNTASIGGLVAGAGTGPYAAAKHAVVGLSKSLRAELAMRKARVGVTIVCPGKVATPITRRLNARPGASPGPVLPAELQAVSEAMQSANGGMSAADAGRMIVDAVKTNAQWVFPGADRHRALVELEVSALMAAFPPTA
jgi:NAD(P)-dependent dehydrogenase (short-subunit alcohol dehydrogenase family)